MAQLNFDARNVAPEAPRNPIPAGVYLCVITESDVIHTRAGGEMLKLTHKVLDGPHANRLVWGNINIRNASPEAERIGQSQLSSLCYAVNQLDLRQGGSEMLHNIPVRVRVSIRPAGPDKTGTYREEQNEVKGYEAAGGQGAAPAPVYPAPTPQPPLSTGAPAAAPAAQAPAAAARLWARRTAGAV